MIALEVVSGVEYGILEGAELPSTIRLLAASFSRHEPLAAAVGLSPAELEALVAAFGPKALAERLSVVARTAETGELVGALLAEDFATPPPGGIADVAPGFAPIGAFLEELDAHYRASREISPGACLHLFMLGIADHAAGRGIARHLLTACLENGKARGYELAVAEATGTVSQHLLRRLGFREIQAAPYRDFVFEGRRVFSSIRGPEATLLMDREL